MRTLISCLLCLVICLSCAYAADVEKQAWRKAMTDYLSDRDSLTSPDGDLAKAFRDWNLPGDEHLAIAGVTTLDTTYYFSSAGSDSNTGLTKLSPLLHAPGMQNCTGHCADLTNGVNGYTVVSPGDTLVLRGGDSWLDTTNPLTQSLPWNWISPNGTQAQPITIGGVDKSWFNAAVCGSTWCYPKMDGGNILSTSVQPSCAVLAPDNDDALIADGAHSWTIWQSIEFKGVCEDTHVGANKQVMFNVGYNDPSNGHNTHKDLYFHGWTHTVGAADGVDAIRSTTFQYGLGDLWTNIRCDGFDTDGINLGAASGSCLYGTFYEVSFSTLRYNSNSMAGGSWSAHDNLIEFTTNGADAGGHPNCWEELASWKPPGPWYNNTVRNNHPIAECIFLAPVGADQDVFGNVIYNNDNLPNSAGEPLIYNTNGTFANIRFMYNTYDGGPGANFVATFGINNKITYIGNLFINCTSDATCEGGTPIATSSNVFFSTNTVATNHGYPQSNDYRPQTANCKGAGLPCPIQAGRNITGLCSGPAGYALCKDSSDGGKISTRARPKQAAWDVGAFQFVPVNGKFPASQGAGATGGPADVINPPVNRVPIMAVIKAAIGAAR